MVEFYFVTSQRINQKWDISQRNWNVCENMLSSVFSCILYLLEILYKNMKSSVDIGIFFIMESESDFDRIRDTIPLIRVLPVGYERRKIASLILAICDPKSCKGRKTSWGNGFTWNLRHFWWIKKSFVIIGRFQLLKDKKFENWNISLIFYSSPVFTEIRQGRV